MRLLVLTYNSTDAGAFYRATGVFPDLRKKMNIDVDIYEWSQLVIDWSVLLRYDLVYMFRPFNPVAVNLCRYIKSLNLPLWVDYDDNLFDVPPGNKHFLTYGPQTREIVKEILSLADAVTVTTEPLAKVMGKYSRNVIVIPNAFNDYLFNKRELRPKRSNIVLWRGSESHLYDIVAFQHAINKIAPEFLNWQFLFMGMYPHPLKESDNMYHLPDKDVMIYFQNCFNMAPAVLQVPLQDSLFNRCKSNIAFIEGAYFGAVPLVPAWWNVPGVLMYKDNESYYSLLKDALSGAVDLEVMNREAWQYVCDELLLSKVNVKRLELINSLV